MSVIIILLGVVFFLIGFSFYKKHKNLKSVCTMPTMGKVTGMSKEESVSTETDNDGNTKKTTRINYYPVFQYIVDGKIIEKKSTTGTNRPRFTEGQNINVLFNPNNPEQFYVVEDKASGRFGIYFMLFSLVIIIFGIVAIFVPLSAV